MHNMKSVIQNDNAKLLSKHTSPVAALLTQLSSKCPINNEYLSRSLACKAAVSQTPSQTNKYYYGTCNKKFSKHSTAIILLHLGIKGNRKVRNSLSIFGN